MKFISCFAILTMLLMVFSCKSTKDVTPTNHEGRQLLFGSGGGMTGMVKTFALLDNGKLFMKEGMKGNGSFQGMKKAGKGTAKKMFAKLDEMGFMSKEFNHPGNMYSFIEVKEGDLTHKITWGAQDQPVDPAIKELYNSLTTLTKISK